MALKEYETRSGARWVEFQLKKSRGRRLKWIKENANGLRAGGAEEAV
jgi:hypothetical protein